MENCPIEVLVMIFSYLDLESLKSLSVIDAKKIKSAICSTIDIHYCKKIYGLWCSLHREREYLENEYYAIVLNDEWYCSASQEELSPILPLKILTRIYIVKTCTNLLCKLDALEKIIEEIGKLQIVNQHSRETNLNIALDKLQDPNN